MERYVMPINQDLMKAAVTCVSIAAGCFLVTQGQRDVGGLLASTAIGGYLGNITPSQSRPK